MAPGALGRGAGAQRAGERRGRGLRRTAALEGRWGSRGLSRADGGERCPDTGTALGGRRLAAAAGREARGSPTGRRASTLNEKGPRQGLSRGQCGRRLLKIFLVSAARPVRGGARACGGPVAAVQVQGAGLGLGRGGGTRGCAAVWRLS